jgi:restriction-modification enzyme MmeI-like protein
MGALSSSIHNTWAKSRSSSIKGDPRYTNTSCFETFPWPYPVADAQRERVAEASRNITARRKEICAANSFGLTTLYNLIDEGAYIDLKALHGELDEAVAAAYGWPKTVAQNGDEIVQRLLILNREIVVGVREYDPFNEELIFIPPPRAEVSRLTPERQPRHSGADRPPGA